MKLKEQTAMQELKQQLLKDIAYLGGKDDHHDDKVVAGYLKTIVDDIDEKFSPKEKQQIIDSFNEGYREAEIDSKSPTLNGDVSEFSNAEDYYNNKYNKQ